MHSQLEIALDSPDDLASLNLQLARTIRRAEHLAEVGRVRHVINGLSVDDGVEYVECLEAEFKLHPFPNWERAEQGCVEIPEPRRAQSIPSEIAKCVLARGI